MTNQTEQCSTVAKSDENLVDELDCVTMEIYLISGKQHAMQTVVQVAKFDNF